MRKKFFRTLFLVLVLAFLYSPILLLTFYSFTDASNIGMAMNFSFDNYITLFTTEELTDMIIGTLVLALSASAIATVLGTIGSVGSFYSGRKTRSLMNTLNQIPVVNADVVTGFSICILLVVVFGVSKDTYLPLLAGHVALCAPFVYLSVTPKLKQMDPSIYEAALDLGATPKTAFVKIIIPQIISGVISGFALCVTLSLDDYFITTYTKPAAFDTISTYVVNATKGAQTEIKTALWALSAIIFCIVAAVVVLMNINFAKKPAGSVKKKGGRV